MTDEDGDLTIDQEILLLGGVEDPEAPEPERVKHATIEAEPAAGGAGGQGLA